MASMTRLDEMRELFTFNAWAMRRLLDDTAKLSEEEIKRDMGNSFSSIRDTLVHMVGAEWVWLSRWQGTSPNAIPNTKANMGHGEVVQWWQQINDEREAFFATLTEEALDRMIAYRNFAGKDFAFPLWQMLRHVVNHATYHRGQVVTMMRQLGHAPTATDMILMYQEKQLSA